MGTSPFTPLTLNGISHFSSDLQNILSRAVQIAQIPIVALQNKDADVLARSNLLSNLGSVALDLATSLHNLGTVAASQGLAASSPNPNAVTVTNSGSTTPASYTHAPVTSLEVSDENTS